MIRKKKGSAIKIYPNPTDGQLTIELLKKTLGENNSIEIRGISGQLVLTESLNSIKKQLDISHLSKGIYFITVRNAVRVETKKLVLKP